MSTFKNILIVDDNLVNRKILGNILEPDYSVIEARDGEEALGILEKQSDSIAGIILDLIMPVMDGYEFLKVYRERQEYKDIPVLIATINDARENEKKTLELGAWDFLTKPYDPDIIRFRLRNAIARSQMNALQDLKYVTEFDTLTGIYSKNKFFEETGYLLETNPNQRFVFVRMDIDRFQLMNAFFGTKEGDRLLQYIADYLKSLELRFPICTYGRIEADIFCVCLPYMDNGSELLNEFRKKLSEFNTNYDVVPSIGLYFIDDRSYSVEEMYNRASLAAKTCKGKYVEYYAVYQEDMSLSLINEQQITNEMRNALFDKQFIVYYQPKYSIADRKIHGAEALVRWRHPMRGMILPADFVPVFERNGFVSHLDFYVWEHVCKQISQWRREGKDYGPISVNVSRVNLYNPKIADIIIDLVQRYQVFPKDIQFELTESAYIDNPAMMKAVMNKLQQHGFTILMDDFGTGYSSLSMLKDIMVDIIKIDMRFLEQSEVPGRGRNILASVVRLAKWINVPAIVEGVEDEEQVEFLNSIGCEYAQGFYFSRPVPVEAYESLFVQDAQKDITDLPKNEVPNLEEFFKSNPYTELLFKDVFHAIVIFEYYDSKIELIRVSDGFYQIYGIEDCALRMQEPLEQVDVQDRARLLDTFEEAIHFGRGAECIYLRNKQDGTQVYIRIRANFIQMVGNKHLMYGVLEDVTSQKMVDLELQKYRSLASDTDRISTILIVDDSDVERELLRFVFPKQKYQLLEAADGQKALDILSREANNVDAILLDLMMPGMHGEICLGIIKNKYPNIPIVILTIDSSESEQVKTLQLGADDYVIKPFVPEVILRRVENVLHANRMLRNSKAEEKISAED